MRKKITCIALNPEELEVLRQRAKRIDVSVSWLVRRSLKKYLEEGKT